MAVVASTARDDSRPRLTAPHSPGTSTGDSISTTPRPSLAMVASTAPSIYAGAPVDYHVGPAWLAGATERVLGRGVYAVSFGLVPLLGILCTAIAILHVLSVHGIPYRLAAAATAVADDVAGAAQHSAWAVTTVSQEAWMGGVMSGHFRRHDAQCQLRPCGRPGEPGAAFRPPLAWLAGCPGSGGARESGRTEAASSLWAWACSWG